jgi:hypothetical protein
VAGLASNSKSAVNVICTVMEFVLSILILQRISPTAMKIKELDLVISITNKAS